MNKIQKYYSVSLCVICIIIVFAPTDCIKTFVLLFKFHASHIQGFHSDFVCVCVCVLPIYRGSHSDFVCMCVCVLPIYRGFHSDYMCVCSFENIIVGKFKNIAIGNLKNIAIENK